MSQIVYFFYYPFWPTRMLPHISYWSTSQLIIYLGRQYASASHKLIFLVESFLVFRALMFHIFSFIYPIFDWFLLAVHQNAACFAPEQTGADMKPGLLQQSVSTNLSNAFNNGMSSLHPCMQPSVDMSIHARRLDISPNMLFAQNSNLGMVPTVNGGIMKTEPGYGGSSQFIYGANGNVMEARPAMGDPSISSFGSVESNSQHPNDTILDPDTSSFGFLGQIPRNFSLSDLTADFSNTGILLFFFISVIAVEL